MPCLYVCVDNYHYIDYCWYIFAIYVSSGLSIIYTINCSLQAIEIRISTCYGMYIPVAFTTTPTFFQHTCTL